MTWRKAPECTTVHPYGEEGWRPTDTEVHEHRVRIRPRARLTREQVASIRNAHWQQGVSAVRLALQYDVHRATVGRILRNETWVGV